jgi:hypothetical protein
LESLKRRDCVEDLGVGRRVIVKWLLGSRIGGCGWINWLWLGTNGKLL